MKYLQTFFAKDNSSLHNAIQANSIFSELSGLILIFWSKSFANLFGVDNNYVFIGMGVGLLIWAFLLYKESMNTQISPFAANIAIAGDILWVLGSILIVSMNIIPLTSQGIWTIAIIGDIVLAFAIWQYFALKNQS